MWVHNLPAMIDIETKTSSLNNDSRRASIKCHLTLSMYLKLVLNRAIYKWQQLKLRHNKLEVFLQEKGMTRKRLSLQHRKGR